MRRFPFIIMLALLMGITSVSCFRDDDESKTLKKYAEWEEANTEWFNEQATLKGSDGKLYYTTVSPSWDTKSRVLMHWFNDTIKTQGNLKPIYTSTVDVKYRGMLYDSTPFDSSYLRTTPADSIFRTYLPNNIEGWSAAITHMHVGDSCRVVIPYTLGYGSTTSGSIKPYSMLVFDVALKGIYKYEGK